VKTLIQLSAAIAVAAQRLTDIGAGCGGTTTETFRATFDEAFADMARLSAELQGWVTD
jgi:precorrin-6B methylase 2